MNELQAEHDLLKVLASTCAQVRRMGTAATAKVAIRYEERYLKEQDKLAAKIEEARQLAVGEVARQSATESAAA